MVRRVLWCCAVALVTAAPSMAQYKGVPLRVNPVRAAPMNQSGQMVTTIQLGPAPAPTRPAMRGGIVPASYNAPEELPLPPVPSNDVVVEQLPPPQSVVPPSPPMPQPHPFPMSPPTRSNVIMGEPLPPSKPPFAMMPPPGIGPVVTSPSPPLSPVVTPTTLNGPFPPAPVQTTVSGAIPLPMPQQLGPTPPPVAPQTTIHDTAHQGPSVDTWCDDIRLTLFGSVRGDMVYSSARPIAPGTPFLLAPDSPFDLEQDSISVHARASTLGAIFSGPDIYGFKAGGLVLLLLYNDNLISDRYGILPYEVWGDLKNENWRFAAGLQRDVFNPVDPGTIAFSRLYGSGNTGNYRGQFRVERFSSPVENAQITWQFALSDPISTFVTDAFRVSEDNGWPNVEARVALGLGPMEGEGLAARRPFEVGLSGIVGQLRTTPINGQRVTADVWGLGTDFRWKLSDRLGVQGELYTGQTLGTYNGGALQTISPTTLDGVRSSGAWGEVYYYLCPCVHTHVGYGIDDPDDDDTDAPPAIFRNETYFGNIVWDVTKQFHVGFETTWRRTAYPGPPTNQGMTFHTMVQWTF